MKPIPLPVVHGSIFFAIDGQIGAVIRVFRSERLVDVDT
jgi:hypothetical protein